MPPLQYVYTFPKQTNKQQFSYLFVKAVTYASSALYTTLPSTTVM